MNKVGIIDLSFINKTDIEPQIMLKGYSYGSSPNCKPQGKHKVMDNCGACNRYGECDCSECTYDCDHCDYDYDCW